jgi:hypothetical protein
MLTEMLHPDIAGARHEGTAWVRRTSPSQATSVP